MSTRSRSALADLKPSHVEQLAVRMRVKGCSPSTVRQTYTVLRSVLETAVRDELLAGNPAASVKRPGVPRTEAHYLSIAEVASLLDAVKDSRCAPLLRLLVATGLRPGEALALHWSDVDLTNSLLRVRGTLSRVNGHLVISEPKTERSRRDVPLSPTTVTLLRSVKASQAIERLWRPRSGLRRASSSPPRAERQSSPGTHCGRSTPRPRLWA
jgi:integrase